MSRSGRILAVTLGLILAGAVCGALAGTIALGLSIAIQARLRDALDLELLGFAAAPGAVLGAILLPSAAWLLLRRVPLGRIIAGVVGGTIVGGVVGWMLPLYLVDPITRAIGSAVLGFGVAVGLLRPSARRGHASAPSLTVVSGASAPLPGPSNDTLKPAGARVEASGCVPVSSIDP